MHCIWYRNEIMKMEAKQHERASSQTKLNEIVRKRKGK